MGDKSDIECISETYVDENGITQEKKVPKIKEEILNRIKEENQLDEKDTQKITDKNISNDLTKVDELENTNIIQRPIDEDTIKRSPESNNLNSTVISTIGPNGEEIKKTVL